MPAFQLQQESHIWYVVPETIRSISNIEWCRSVLSEREHKRCKRLIFEKDRHRYLISHALVRQTLSRYINLEPPEWKFNTGERGKPEIANPIDLPLRFNLTHTQGLAACIVNLTTDCGIDAELISNRHNPRRVARRMFSAEEQHDLHRLEGQAQMEYFFERWTLREAYVKALGVGISFPVRKLCFDVQTGSDIHIHFQPDIEDHPADWQFRLFRPTQQHILSIALRNGSKPPRKIVINRIESLRSE